MLQFLKPCGDLTFCVQVVKKAGVIIKPVKFQEVDPNERVDDEHPRSHHNQKPKKGNK